MPSNIKKKYQLTGFAFIILCVIFTGIYLINQKSQDSSHSEDYFNRECRLTNEAIQACAKASTIDQCVNVRRDAPNAYWLYYRICNTGDGTYDNSGIVGNGNFLLGKCLGHAQNGQTDNFKTCNFNSLIKNGYRGEIKIFAADKSYHYSESAIQPPSPVKYSVSKNGNVLVTYLDDSCATEYEYSMKGNSIYSKISNVIEKSKPECKTIIDLWRSQKDKDNNGYEKNHFGLSILTAQGHKEYHDDAFLYILNKKISLEDSGCSNDNYQIFKHRDGFVRVTDGDVNKIGNTVSISYTGKNTDSFIYTEFINDYFTDTDGVRKMWLSKESTMTVRLLNENQIFIKNNIKTIDFELWKKYGNKYQPSYLKSTTENNLMICE
jgi:hypothetical protein